MYMLKLRLSNFYMDNSTSVVYAEGAVFIETPPSFPRPQITKDDGATETSYNGTTILQWTLGQLNGSKDPGESALQNVKVYLIDSYGDTADTKTTDQNSSYTFANVVPGSCSVDDDNHVITGLRPAALISVPLM